MDDSVAASPPLPCPPLSASSIGSFAYLTVKDRLPVILTRIIDYLHRERTVLASKYGDGAIEGCKEVVSRLSQMKNEMQTNKDLQPLHSPQTNNPYDDSEIWNEQYNDYLAKHCVAPKWFASPWLYVECYMYARIHEAFNLCDSLKSFDPFEEQKEKGLHDSMVAVEALAEKVLCVWRDLSSPDRMKQHLLMFFEVCLWGNKCDLSLSGGADRSQVDDVLTSLVKLRNKIIVNDFEEFWKFLTSLQEDKREIVLVLDNAGFELVTDLCLVTVLMEAGVTTHVTIHTKTRPWFVSDAMEKDLTWIIDTLRTRSGCVGELASRWSDYLGDGRWSVSSSKFWTTAYDFTHMQTRDPHLYSVLSKAPLLIFKGDLNYRKLTGDLEWPCETTFRDSLRGFTPTSLLALRTAKGGPVVGLTPGQQRTLSEADQDWNISGDYGMIQFYRHSSS